MQDLLGAAGLGSGYTMKAKPEMNAARLKQTPFKTVHFPVLGL